MQHFVLTGQAGLIGSKLLNKLVSKGNMPVLLVDKRRGKDIADIASYRTELPPDIMYHLAAHCSIRHAIWDTQRPMDNNVIGTHKVLEYCRAKQIKKVVFTSSTRVLYPEKNPYTASKIYCEELIKSYSQCYGIDYTIVRPSTVYGGFNDLTGRLVHKWMAAVLNNKPLIIYGDKNKTLDFTYVDDFVDGLLWAAKQSNSEFNISYGQETKLVDVANYIIELHGSGEVKFADAELAQPQQVCIDTDFKCSTSVEEGIKKTYEWYRQNTPPLWDY